MILGETDPKTHNVTPCKTVPAQR